MCPTYRRHTARLLSYISIFACTYIYFLYQDFILSPYPLPILFISPSSRISCTYPYSTGSRSTIIYVFSFPPFTHIILSGLDRIVHSIFYLISPWSYCTFYLLSYLPLIILYILSSILSPLDHIVHSIFYLNTSLLLITLSHSIHVVQRSSDPAHTCNEPQRQVNDTTQTWLLRLCLSRVHVSVYLAFMSLDIFFLLS